MDKNIKVEFLRAGLQYYRLCTERLRKKMDLVNHLSWSAEDYEDVKLAVCEINSEIRRAEEELEGIFEIAKKSDMQIPFEETAQKFSLKKEEKYVLIILFFRQFSEKYCETTIYDILSLLDIEPEYFLEKYTIFQNLESKKLIIVEQDERYAFPLNWNVKLEPTYLQKIFEYFSVAKKKNVPKNEEKKLEANFLTIRKPLLSFDKIVLPLEKKEAIKRALKQAYLLKELTKKWGLDSTIKYGRGVSMLFYGPPGTGKTATCEAIAYELKKKIGIVQYSSILSRWVGDSEKAVDYVFEEAKIFNCVLVFDEADALFGQRMTETYSTDRMHNYMTNILMQKMERFEGVVILTTNREFALDEAFNRRIILKVKFEIPGPEERTRIWRVLIPNKVPLAKDVHFEELGLKFELTGGEIKNVVLKALVEFAEQRLPELPMRLLIKYAEEELDEKREIKNRVSKIGFNNDKVLKTSLRVAY
ncbi:MAG: ATP-binding protein [candidate division WOR-3 bacterium]